MRKKEARKEKGQVTIFIIIAIVIIALIAVFLLAKENVLDFGKEKIAPEVKPIYSFVEECVKTTGENAVYYIGQTGGYFVIPNSSTDFGIAYYYDKGNNYMPSKEKIEEELGSYVDFMLFFCVKEFEDFGDFQVEQNEVKTKAKISEGKVIFNVEYPLKVSKGDKTYNFKKFQGETLVRLEQVYALAYNITQEQMKTKNNICISCIYELAREKELFVEMNEHPDNQTIVFTIRDEKSEILKGDYRFNFANKYEAWG